MNRNFVFETNEKFGNTKVFAEFERDPNYTQMCKGVLGCADCTPADRVDIAIKENMVDSAEEYDSAVASGHITEYPSGIVQIWS